MILQAVAVRDFGGEGADGGRSSEVAGGLPLGPGGKAVAAQQAQGDVVEQQRPERESTPSVCTVIQHRGALGQHLFLSAVQVGDTEIQVELLWPTRVRPQRRLVLRHPLEGQDEAGPRVQREPVLAERPSPIRLVDRAAKDLLVELNELTRVGAVQHHALQISDHGGRSWVATEGSTTHHRVAATGPGWTRACHRVSPSVLLDRPGN